MGIVYNPEWILTGSNKEKGEMNFYTHGVMWLRTEDQFKRLVNLSDKQNAVTVLEKIRSI